MLGGVSSLLFAKAVSLFFEADTVVVCTPDAADPGAAGGAKNGSADADHLLDFWVTASATLAHRLVFYPGAGGEEGAPARPEEEEEEKVLVFCAGESLVRSLIPGLGLGANTVWLVPEGEDKGGGAVAPAALRLDSNWISARKKKEEEEEEEEEPGPSC